MKRILAIMVLLAYTATAIGFSFSVHYCGGSVQGVYLTVGNETGCCDDDEATDGCCEDKVVKARSNDDHTTQVAEPVGKILCSAAAPGVVWYSNESRAAAGFTSVTKALHGPAPPLIKGVPLFLLHRNLRI